MSETNDQRRYYERMIDEIGAEYRSHIDELQDENAKLRELVDDLYQCSRLEGCDHCGDEFRSICSVLDHMRELGIEVD